MTPKAVIVSCPGWPTIERQRRAPAQRGRAHFGNRTMSLELRDKIHWCNCAGRAVFLDRKADRYFCLPHGANDAFLRLASKTSRAGDAEWVEPLVARGVLVEGTGGAGIQPPATIEPPAFDVLGSQPPRAALFPLIRAGACEAAAACALRTRGFDQLIEARQRSSSSGAMQKPAPHRAIAQIAASSAVISILTRRHDRCLVRALAVHSMCIKRSVDAKLVFGVIAHPFTAHCWVQYGRAVLVGGYEQARLYTPILVIG